MSVSALESDLAREVAELKKSQREIRRVLAEYLDDIGSRAANALMDAMHPCAWEKDNA